METSAASKRKCYKVNTPRRKMDKFELASDTSAVWKQVLLRKEMLSKAEFKNEKLK